MSLYRKEIHSGKLVVTKRCLLRWWKWVLHYHADREIQRLRNLRAKHLAEARRLGYTIPLMEKEYNDELAKVRGMDGGKGIPWTGSWSFRPSPVVALNPNVKLDTPKKKPEVKKKSKPLLELRQPEE